MAKEATALRQEEADALNLSAKKKNVLPDLSAEAAAMKAKIAELEASLAAEKARKSTGFGMEISDKGCLVIRLGTGGYPISVYRDKLDVLIENFEEVKAFVEANRNKIKRNKSE